MGAALVTGWVQAGYSVEDLVVADPDAERRRVHEALGVRAVPHPAWAITDADVVVLAVKPALVSEVVESAREAFQEGAVCISIAAGVQIAALEALLPGVPVIRAMPNSPALVQMGACAIAGGAHATEADLELAERLLGVVGSVVRVPEHLLDAVTGLSGSGPAYVFLVAEALIEAGVLNGLPRDVAIALVEQTLRGSAELLRVSDETPEALRAQVTSPGGTTAAGLKVLEERGVRAAFMEAVTQAANRSRELGA